MKLWERLERLTLLEWLGISIAVMVFTLCLLGALDCFAQDYQSRSDAQTIPLTSIPKFGAAGSVASEPAYGNRIIRLTDKNTAGGNLTNSSFTTGFGGSGDVPRVWNSDSTIISINNKSGDCFPIKFDPVNIAVGGALYGASPTKRAFLTGCGVFSTSNPNTFYVLKGATTYKLDYTNRVTPPTLPGTLVYNFASCAALGSILWKGTAGPNLTDTQFTMGFSTGIQNSAYTVTTYDTVKKVCYNLNTKTGVVKQLAGTKWTTIGTVDVPDRFLIHNIKVKDSVAYIRAAEQSCLSTCSAYIYAYVPGQAKLYPISTQPSGHWAAGCKDWLNQPGNRYSYFWKRLYSLQDQLTSVWVIAPDACGGDNQPACASTFDQHSAWLGDCSDTGVVCMSTVTKDDLIQKPYEKEIVCFTTDGSNKQYRFSHTFSSLSYSADNFNAAQAIGQPDQRGKFYAWTTKAGGQFGCTNGKATCSEAYKRSDVIIVELR